MKIRLLIAGFFLLLFNNSQAQTVIWTEDFGTPPANTLANGFNSGNGAWTVTNVGFNGADANVWYVSGEECGNSPGACGSVCSGGDASLHLGASSIFGGDLGAAYAAGGLGFFFIETDKRVESPTIDLTGQSNITLTFNYIEDYAGQAFYDPIDDATLWYFDGVSWAQIDPLAVSPAGCAPQGTWTTFSMLLPASANNNPNVKIGFHWHNNDDNNGTDPSFAVDDIQLTVPAVSAPIADFSASATTLCEGDCIDFTDLSTLSTNPTWSWTFTGAATATSSVQNPTNICYNTAGTYQVELTVTDDNGTDTETKVAYITVNAPPNAGSNASQDLCNNTTLDLNTVLSGQDPGGTWVETSGTPSGQFNAGTGVLDGNGLPIGNVYTFDYTVTGTVPCPDATATVTITIIDCSVPSPPVADFSASATTICEGDCIDFTDLSTLSTNPTWSWTFTGAATATSSVQNPTNICYNTAGTYQVELTVTDDNGTDTETKVGYITVNAPPNAGSNASQNLCTDSIVDLNTVLSGQDPGGTWLETSGTPSGQFNAGTGVLDGTGLTVGNVYTFDYTVTGMAPCPDATATVTITIVDCSSGAPPTADFNASQTTICEGDCIDFTDASTILGANPTWSWTFTGAATPTSNVQNPTNICYNTAGTYQVELTVTDANGTDTETKVSYITVNAAPTVTASASPNDTICSGDQVTLTGGGASTYTWDNGVTNGVAFTPTGTTTYTVTGDDGSGCTAQATITIVVENCDPLTANWWIPSTSICNGDCITFTDSSSGNIASWEWTFGGGGTPNTVSNDPNPTVCFDSTGTFTVNLQIAGGGDTSNYSQVISVFDVPIVDATLDTLIDLGGSADLIAVGSSPGSYLWSPSEFVDCDTCAVTTASPYLSTIYTVALTDLNGCTGYDSVDVQVNFIEGIDVPSAFSPNGDGNNDVLYVKGIGIETMIFTVYNRYGQKVFESDDQNIGWDGTFRGRDENSGVFTWMLEYNLVNGATGMLKGNTTLIR
ncbi:MAG: PKD domain-containing protein [Crocinitomicaceae bacterium]|nr:PKD domain-containing protein [Crocinitomicaceae bacterium]